MDKEHNGCIFYGNEDSCSAELTQEHIFPEAIGGALTINEVCKKHNNDLGSKIDSLLTDHWVIQLARFALKIKGGNKLPNPFGNGVLADDPNLKVTSRVDNSRNIVFKLLPSITKPVVDSQSYEFTITIDESDRENVQGIVGKIMGRQKTKSGQKEDVLLVDQTISSSKIIKNEVSIDTKEYKVAMLKIIYELSYYWLGKTFLDDSIAQSIKKSILNPNILSTDFDLAKQISLCKIRSNDEPHMHIGILNSYNGKLWCYVRVFNIFEGNVLVSEDAGRYPHFREGGKRLIVDTITGIFEEKEG